MHWWDRLDAEVRVLMLIGAFVLVFSTLLSWWDSTPKAQQQTRDWAWWVERHPAAKEYLDSASGLDDMELRIEVVDDIYYNDYHGR